MSRLVLTAAALAMMGPALAQAQLLGGDKPPQNSRPLSQLLQQIETRPDFAYIKDIEWDDDHYNVEYVTKEDDEVELNVDPATGKVEED